MNLHFTRLFFVKYRSALAVNSPRIRFDIIKKKKKKQRADDLWIFFIADISLHRIIPGVEKSKDQWVYCNIDKNIKVFYI